MTTTTKPGQRGFTLLELMIALVVVSILVAIAYPSYQNQVRRAQRADAKAVLFEDAQFLERNYTETNRYNLKSDGNALTAADLPFQSTPRDSNRVSYQISFEAGSPTASAFTLQAIPQGNQTKDPCGTLTLDQAGIKGSGGTDAECWAR